MTSWWLEVFMVSVRLSESPRALNRAIICWHRQCIIAHSKRANMKIVWDFWFIQCWFRNLMLNFDKHLLWFLSNLHLFASLHYLDIQELLFFRCATISLWFSWIDKIWDFASSIRSLWKLIPKSPAVICRCDRWSSRLPTVHNDYYLN